MNAATQKKDLIPPTTVEQTPAEIINICQAALKKIPKDFVPDRFKILADIEGQRKALNEQAADVRKEVKEAGIMVSAFNRSFKRSLTEPELLARYDASYAKCCKDGGVEVHPDLFG